MTEVLVTQWLVHVSFISVTEVLVTQWLLHVSIISVTKVTQRLKLEQENVKEVSLSPGKASNVDSTICSIVACAHACFHVD